MRKNCNSFHVFLSLLYSFNYLVYGSSVFIIPGTAMDWEASGGIFTRGTGYETLQVSKAKTKVLQFMLKVLRPCTIFCFTFAHYG